MKDFPLIPDGPWHVREDAAHPSNRRISTNGRCIIKVYAPDLSDEDGLAAALAFAAAALPDLLGAVQSSQTALEEAATILEGKGLPGVASVLRNHVGICDSALAKVRGEAS